MVGIHLIRSIGIAAALLTAEPENANNASICQGHVGNPKQEIERYGLLRGCVPGDFDENELTFYGTGRTAIGDGKAEGIVYCLRLNIETGGLKRVWVAKCAAPPLLHNAAILHVPGIEHLPSRLAIRSESGGFSLYETSTGRHLEEVPDEHLLDYASIPGVGHVAVTARAQRLRLRITGLGDSSEVEIIDLGLAHPTAASILGHPSPLRVVVATCAPTGTVADSDGAGADRTVISMVEVQGATTTKETPIWSSPYRLLSNGSLTASATIGFAASLQDNATGRIVVFGAFQDRSGEIGAEVVTVREERGDAAASYYYPCLGRALAFFNGQLIVSRPGDPEASTVLSYSLPRPAEKWRITGTVGCNLGTRVEAVGASHLLISGGALGAGLINRNGELRVYRCPRGADPELLVTVHEKDVDKILR